MQKASVGTMQSYRLSIRRCGQIVVAVSVLCAVAACENPPSVTEVPAAHVAPAASVASAASAPSSAAVASAPSAPSAPAGPQANHSPQVEAHPALVEVADVSYASKRLAVAPAAMRMPAVAHMQEVGDAQPYRERYGPMAENAVQEVARQPLSTFGVDVDTGSYANVRRFLRDGRLPPAQAVRVEELLNYFPYQRPAWTQTQHPFVLGVEVADSPWHPQAKVMKIHLAAVNQTLGSLPPANLVFLVDVSGSMQSERKLPLVKSALRILTQQLRAQDTVSIITYASGEKLALPPTSGRDKEQILRVIDGLRAGGATAGEAAIRMAYEQAARGWKENGINRIILATDGDFNVGITDFETLKNMVAEKRKTGISLTALGFGTDNYNEHLMEQLADAGDGNYSYIDTEKEARKVLQEQLSSTLATVAQDVKIQVEFNPATVAQYRLIGYENRLLNQEDFRNDRVDSGDMGAGHTVTALYEIMPAGQPGWLSPSRYQHTTPTHTSAAHDGRPMQEYAHIRLRYKRPGDSNSVELAQPVPVQSRPLAQGSEDMRFAVAVATYGQLLKGGKYTGQMDWAQAEQLARGALGADAYGLRQEFVELLQTARRLSSQRPVQKE